ncbi:MAG: hydroxymethylbilane synthase [Crocinitomicaceae bacterium]
MPEKRIIRIGTRGSDLALWQANFVKSSLEHLGQQVEIIIIHTQGDKIQDLSFDKLEGKGFFTKEIEQALLQNEIDLAVHSHKDLETTSPEGLIIAAVSDREDPSELLLVRNESTDKSQKWQLKNSATIGTSSARRKSQILTHRPDLIIKDLRGNVPTRIQKLRDGHYDAILLAKAGVNRLQLNLSDLFCVTLDPTEFVPAPAQGVLGLQIRSNDSTLQEILGELNHAETKDKIDIERGVLKKMEGGCQLPLGVLSTVSKTYVSYSKNANESAHYFSFDNDEFVVDKIVGHLKSI